MIVSVLFKGCFSTRYFVKDAVGVRLFKAYRAFLNAPTLERSASFSLLDYRSSSYPDEIPTPTTFLLSEIAGLSFRETYMMPDSINEFGRGSQVILEYAKQNGVTFEE